MGESAVFLRVDEDLRFFLAPGNRRPSVQVRRDGTSTVGHLVESLGVPLTEVGSLVVAGRPAAASCRPADGDVVDVGPVTRPQRVPLAPLRFVLDVHLGTLTRRLRLLGVDAAYSNDVDDDHLIAQANEQDRVLLTQDRGLLRRRSLRLGGYVRGARPDQQLRDVLERFAPPLAPWTICTACNGQLAAVPKADVERELQPGTRGPTTRSRAARPAVASTGAGRTTGGWRASSPALLPHFRRPGYGHSRAVIPDYGRPRAAFRAFPKQSSVARCDAASA